jgi:uncharacterized Zn finger protein
MRVRKEELRDVVNRLENVEVRCLSCGYPLNVSNLSWYDHGEGCYWVYYECPRCLYQSALWKVIRNEGKM